MQWFESTRRLHDRPQHPTSTSECTSLSGTTRDSYDLATAFRRGLTISVVVLLAYSLLKAGNLDRSMKTATSNLMP